jgi:hypothetical protein
MMDRAYVTGGAATMPPSEVNEALNERCGDTEAKTTNWKDGRQIHARDPDRQSIWKTLWTTKTINMSRSF